VLGFFLWARTSLGRRAGGGGGGGGPPPPPPPPPPGGNEKKKNNPPPPVGKKKKPGCFFFFFFVVLWCGFFFFVFFFLLVCFGLGVCAGAWGLGPLGVWAPPPCFFGFLFFLGRLLAASRVLRFVPGPAISRATNRSSPLESRRRLQKIRVAMFQDRHSSTGALLPSSSSVLC